MTYTTKDDILSVNKGGYIIKYKTEEERKEGRRLSLLKYNCSQKRKECNKRYVLSHKEQCYKWSKEWADNNRDRINFLQRERNKLPEVKKRKKEREKRYYEKNREKRLAKDKINNMVRSNKIIKPNKCSVCGVISKVQGHHPDYSKPLEVIWCCHSCHVNFHRS